MKYNLLFITSLLVFLSVNFDSQAQFPYTPRTAPYYGTAGYPYWGKYVKTPFNDITAARWINTDSVVIGWDWSLPSFVEAPKKSAYTFMRMTSFNTTPINALTPPNFVCKPTVTHWIKWNILEATKDVFTFGQLIKNIETCYSKGYSSIVRIHTSATDFAPTWVNTVEGAPILPKNSGANKQNYDVSDPRFHARYLKLVEEIGKSGIPKMKEVVGLYVGYASDSNGDEGIGDDTKQHVRERLDAWANITDSVRGKVYMGGSSNYGLAKGFGIRRGFVEMYLYYIPSSSIGQKVDSNGYLYIDETNQIISKNLFHGEENEEYDEKWATVENDFRFGTTTESFPYRYFTANLRLLQMRCNEALFNNFSLMPEMSAWVGQELGRTIDEAPDVWSWLRESYVQNNGNITVKNFERWLFQRDTTGYTTKPAVKINQAIKMWMVQSGKYYDYVAREGKKIGFNIDKNWNGVKDSLAFKVSVFDYNAGTLNLKYSNGNEIVTLAKPLLGDSLLKTYTFFVKDFKNGANIGGKFDFSLEAGTTTEKIVVSMVRVVKAKESSLTALKDIKNDTPKSISVYPNPATDVVNIEHNQDATIRIYDMRGALLYNEKSSGGKTNVDMRKFKNSKILLLNVLSDKNSEFVKIIVE